MSCPSLGYLLSLPAVFQNEPDFEPQLLDAAFVVLIKCNA